jgi:uncharacterized protein YbaP (TraB family)
MACFYGVERKSANIAFYVLFLGLTFFISTGLNARQVKQAATAKHCLWVVETSAHPVFLMGSLHVLKSDAYPLAKAIYDAYAVSQKIVFETDLRSMLDPAVQAKMMSMGLYPEGDNLSQNIPVELQRSLKKKLRSLGLPMKQFERFRPWFLAVTLTTLELQRLGFSPVYGIDVHFYDRAGSDEKEIGFLEPVAYQLDLLGKMKARDQNAFLSQTLTDLEVAAEMAAEMVMYWKKGDVDNLYRVLFKSFEGYPEIENRLLRQRNKDWVLKIEEMMKEDKTVFIIVGAGHLIGPGSVVEILKKKGYTVKQK